MIATAIRPRDPRSMSAVARIVRGTVAVATGVVHLALVPAHFEEGAWLGALFLADGVALAAAGIWVMAARSPLARASASGVLLLTVVAYLVSRTLGLPGFGHEAWDALGMGTSAAEVAAVVALAIPPHESRCPARI